MCHLNPFLYGRHLILYPWLVLQKVKKTSYEMCNIQLHLRMDAMWWAQMEQTDFKQKAAPWGEITLLLGKW